MPEIISRKQAKENGLSRYFTGKPCPKGHIEYRNYKDSSCTACCREKSARARREDPGISKRHQENRKARYSEDPEARKAAVNRSTEWASRNKEKRASYLREYYSRNKEKSALDAKARYEKNRLNPEWVKAERERQAKKHADNPEAKRCQVRKRRSRLRGCEGSHTHKDVLEILESQKYQCIYCGSSLKESYEVDHIVAISRGGSNWPGNIQCLCAICNRRKWCNDHEEFAKKIEAEKKGRR